MYGDTIYLRLVNATKDEKKEICKALQIEVTNDNVTICNEFRSAAGHSFMNIFRRNDKLSYKRILIDVADKLKPGTWTMYTLNDNAPIEWIEDEIMRYLTARFQKQWNKLNPSERKRKEEEFKKELEKAGYPQVALGSISSMLASQTIGAVVAPRIALSSAPLFSLGSSSFILSSTGIGLLVSIPLLIGTLGGPAYRKTIPATLQLIRIRKRLEAEALL